MEYISYDTIRNSIKFEKNSYFANYLSDIFLDLSNRSTIIDSSREDNHKKSSKTQLRGISKLIFNDYFKLPVFICEKMFMSLDKDNDSYLNLKEFSEGMCKLYLGSFQETAEIIFNIFDFDKDGNINIGDVKVLISYLPIKSTEEESEYKNQMKSLEEIDQILKDTFENESILSFKEFLSIIEGKKSDIYIQLLLFFYNHKPFNMKTVNACKNSRISFHVDKKKMVSGLSEHDKNLRLPSPSKKSSLESTEKFLSHIQTKNSPKVISSPGYKTNKSIVDFNINIIKIDDEEIKDIDDFELEDFFYKFDGDNAQKNLNSFRKYYLVLHGPEITIYISKNKKDMVSFHNLSGTSIQEGESIVKDKLQYYSIIIQIKKGSEFKFFFDSEEKRNVWLNAIKRVTGYKIFNEHYELLHELGTGKFGVVKLGISKLNGNKVAVKIISQQSLNSIEMELIKRELDLMKLFHHPNLVRLLDHFDNNDYIYIIMEYLEGGNLLDIIQEHSEKRFTEGEVATLIKQIVSGIQYLNSYGIIHRDIKPENIMLKEKGKLLSLKIIDFGLTKILAPQEKLAEAMGTIMFAAPEVLKRNPYNKEIDVWSIGVVMYFLLCGQLPFDDINDDNLIKKVIYSDHAYPPELFSNRSKNCIKLIDQCLEKNPEKRITIENILIHEWITKNTK